MIDIIQNPISNGKDDRVIRLHLLPAVVAAAVHERHPGLLAGSVPHLGEERHAQLVLPLSKQLLSGIAQGESQNVLQHQVAVKVGCEELCIFYKVLR